MDTPLRNLRENSAGTLIKTRPDRNQNFYLPQSPHFRTVVEHSLIPQVVRAHGTLVRAVRVHRQVEHDVLVQLVLLPRALALSGGFLGRRGRRRARGLGEVSVNLAVFVDQNGSELGRDEDPGDGKYIAPRDSVNVACLIKGNKKEKMVVSWFLCVQTIQSRIIFAFRVKCVINSFA